MMSVHLKYWMLLTGLERYLDIYSHGKKNRGLAVVKSYRCLVKPEELTEENLTIARVLGWCVELLQAYFLVSDDIMDSSETRRGRPCWYKKENVGSIAINDAIYLETCIYALLKKYLRGRPCYIDIIDLFHETTSRTVHGQCLDVCTASPVEKRVNLSRFTTQRYSAIVKYKTAFYSFHLPVALALHLAGICDEASHSIAQKILLEMGHFFQVQDDFLDCYGDPAVTGKIGSDIEDNKCSWLVVQALAKATAEQKQMLQNDYGKTDAACLARVKDLYEELQLKQAYADYEEQSYRTIISLIEHECTTLPRQIFLDFAHMIYKREK
ncbi:PREDICTED: farnesyl pyrophosphate synthase-like isoform X1 [Priapulus caudatus]|uniref:Farnesyl pyrophosphate synthase n=1 Tax=Priapulus caudatus TaxID=37621 RepID=A0ABM1DV07_PRICU|nr:PREDICTED: farnesyl pyrophosphate synthase-like isoform X1 [Priapulus caudatus]XP_014663779.1 PREDICTED: farnesyl pyrophosphate synthase-like isoform X1 [Priapulus caudatus]XP_014663780.1 PREDICTED: farnesyl pyrophosphate synthase-like isoform X1 [Priapulus caudatus]